MDIHKHNQNVWNQFAEAGIQWSQPVSAEEITAARQGNWNIILTPTKPVPRIWFPESLTGVDILCLASGGGQQAPILAAAGATVTVLDFSEKQLEQDNMVVSRDNLSLKTVQADMADLSMFTDESFDVIVHPVASVYIPDVQPVWNECCRILRPQGILMAGFMNPINYIFNQDVLAEGKFEVKYSLPYSELTDISDKERQHLIDEGDALQFSHTLESQIGGQLIAGFFITGFYEDRRQGHPLAKYMPTHLATRAIKSQRQG